MIRYFDPDKWRSKRPAVAVGIPMTATLHRTAVNQFHSLMLRLREDDVFLPCIESAIASEARNTIINEFLNLPDSVKYSAYSANQMRTFVGYFNNNKFVFHHSRLIDRGIS